MTISATPVVVASPTFSNFATTSGYTSAYQTAVASGSFWYLQSTGAGGRVDIGNVTTAGVVTNYNIQVLSGVPTLQLRSLTTGPDGNVWFNGTVGTAGYNGRLDVSTGTVTVYSNYVPNPSLSGSLGNLVTGSDGKLWYLVKSTTSTNYTYVVKVDPTTGANTVVRDFDIYSSFSDIASDPDGKIWMVNKYRYDRWIHTIDPSTGSGPNYQMPALPVDPAYSNQNYLDRYIFSGGDGNMWFTDSTGAASKRYRLTTNGTFTEDTTPVAGAVLAPIAGADGALWFLHDLSGVRKVARKDTLGNITDYTIPGSSVTGPTNIVLGPDGALWFNYKDSSGMKMGRFGY